MKLESLNSEKFQTLTAQSMQFVVGGGNCETGSGSYCKSDGSKVTYSNDYTDSSGVTNNAGRVTGNDGMTTAGTGDYSQNQLDQRGVVKCK